ncbi:Sok1 protein [Pichia kluyveri]|uniref:Sok1 protein n=1 Tax=Pichia kluyveri TaxID=36015 RepID=A0AAV5R028_PICKL|nr:Sok1 protein [Pichia kluyveri]
MLNHINNSNNDQDLERPPHFKNVFNSNDSSNPENHINTNNIVTSESRRPSLVVINVKNNHSLSHNMNLSAHNNNIPSANSSLQDVNSLNNSDIELDLEINNINNNNPKTKIEDTQIEIKKPLLSQTHSNIDIQLDNSSNSDNTILTDNINNDNINTNNNVNVNKNVIQFNQQFISNFQMLNLPNNNNINNLQSSNNSNKISKKNSSKSRKSVKITKKFRSKSLPNIFIPSKNSHIYPNTHSHQMFLDMYKNNKLNISNNNISKPKHNHSHHSHHSHHHHHHHHHYRQHQQQPSLLLPPVNLHSMHEIDLQEVLKNPQLRHDILFDPQLQFRPNLDGERGKRKKNQSDNYWNMIKIETENLINDLDNKIILNENSPIIVMFQCLKSILISLIPAKDIIQIEEIMDISLITQQLNSKCFNFINFSNWICSIFKLHCAPMRDPWVDELNNLFHKSCNNEKIEINLLIEGFKTLFLILEAMKLDVANHQIRILRPLLCSSAVSFEKEYFKNAIKRNKINFTSSIIWYKRNLNNLRSKNYNSREILNYSILNLLSCSNMTRQFPNSLNFDNTRLLLLRADIRHIICTKLCLILYKTLIFQNNFDKSLLNNENILNLKSEILNIIIDDNGNSKWTKNLKNLSIHLINKLFNKLDSDKIEFANNWLINQTQPSSKVYSLLESKLFEKIFPFLDNSTKQSETVSSIVTTNTNNNNNNINTNNVNINTTANTIESSIIVKSSLPKINDEIIINDELNNIVERLNQLIEFNYNVFGEMYNS